jgi:hypothetical protein
LQFGSIFDPLEFMNQTIERAFSAYWKSLVAKDAKLTSYPKSYRTALKDACEHGFMVGQTDVQLEREVHREADKENRKN